MQVLVDEISQRETSVHHLSLPVEVLLHEANNFATTCHSRLLCEVGALDSVHDNGFPIDALQVLEVAKLDVELTEDFLLRQFTILDKLDSFSLSACQFVFVTDIEGKIFEHELLPVLFIVHLNKLFFVLLLDDVTLDLLCGDWSLLSVLLELAHEL